MSRTIWNAERGWHETDDDYRLVLTPTGAIRWVKIDETEEKERETP